VLAYLPLSTSPVLAGDHFRRETMAGRARMQCDEWLGWPMALEDRHASAGRLMVRHERVSAVHTALGEPCGLLVAVGRAPSGRVEAATGQRGQWFLRHVIGVVFLGVPWSSLRVAFRWKRRAWGLQGTWV